MMIEGERIHKLNDIDVREGEFVLYWMQASQRSEFNHTLEYSIEKANELRLPLIVYFGLTDDFPEGNLRHYKFMLEGLKEVKESLSDRDIIFVVKHSSPEEGAVKIGEEAFMVIVDKGYLGFQRGWRKKVAEELDCPVIEVEADIVVPVETSSEKEEYAARTIRSKINEKRDNFLRKLEERRLNEPSLDYDFSSLNIQDVEAVLKKLDLDKTVKPIDHLTGGTSNAKQHLSDFIDNKLDKYSELRNDPSLDYQSKMSPYLHFGQISPVYIALKILESNSKAVEDYLEELIVRRELAINFVYYNSDYDNLDSLPGWAYETLKEHQNDKREFVYTKEEFENADTYDGYWNAAQNEMKITGKMHNYMRMYWGKKIIEWTETPEKAFEVALELNNKYELDGRDPNSYAGVAWCFGKHDRAWKERDIFGKVRYMNSNGLERKFDMESYLKKIENLE